MSKRKRGATAANTSTTHKRVKSVTNSGPENDVEVAALPASPSKPADASEEQSPLFKLPREIRDQIYGHIAQDITVTVSKRKRGRLICLSKVILVNQQFKHEFMSEMFVSHLLGIHH
jgi:hypothetical protein